MNPVVFVFPGQGAQWPGMGAALLAREPVFAAAVEECESALRPHVGWPLARTLSGDAPLDRVDVIQPALFGLQVGLARLWRSRGIEPAAVVGHSLGEVAAAHVAGALSLEDAARVVAVRSRLFRKVTGAGAMALVGLGWAEATAVVAEQRGRISLAAGNAPGSTVVTGDQEAVHELVERLRWEDVFCRLVDVDMAAHSHHVDPLLPELAAELAGLCPAAPQIPLWSTVTGRRDPVVDAAYWCRNLREPVLFWPVLQQLLVAGHDMFVELSPHPTLITGLQGPQARTPGGAAPLMLASMRKQAPEAFADSLAELRAVHLSPAGFLAGHQVEKQAIFPGAGYLAAALAESEAVVAVEFRAPLAVRAGQRLRTDTDGERITFTVDGKVHATASRGQTGAAAPIDLAEVGARCPARVDVDGLYRSFAARGVDYGPAFRLLAEVGLGVGETLVRLAPPGPAALRPEEPYRMETPVLDACLQAAAPLLPDGDDLYLPHRVGRVWASGEIGQARWAHARRRTDPVDGGIEFDIDASDEDGAVVLSLRGVELRRLRRARKSDRWLYAARWVPVGTVDGAEPADGQIYRHSPGDGLETALAQLLELTRKLAAEPEPRRLWVVTRSGQSVLPGEQGDPVAAALWGMARTIRYEYPELRCTMVDLDTDEQPARWKLPGEDEVAFRDGRAYAFRLTPVLPLPDGPYQVRQDGAGDLDDLVLAPCLPAEPGPGQVQIKVHAAGLNFNDVLRALGMLGDREGAQSFGLECAGEITAVGEGVPGLVPGARVVAAVPAPEAMSSLVTVDARLVAELPGDLGPTAAAALPAAYTTVLYGMERLAGLAAGDRVLIHSAAGGVGLAAVHLARRAGAEIITTAGSERKRDWLRQQGIRHVFDSRSLDFAGQVLDATGGEGVDMVVNSLAGAAVDAGLRVLAPFGRFVELGKRDIAENRPLPQAPFAKSLSFHAVEAALLPVHRPELAGGLLREAVDAVVRGELPALPTVAFTAREAAQAFAFMASARHIGKVVITFDQPELRQDGTYLITGGLGGLGLAAAAQLTAQGARHLALLGRTPPGPDAAERIAALRAAGVEVLVLTADVVEEKSLAEALDAVRVQCPPLRGVVHAAGVLRDRTMAAADPGELREVLRPKVDGTLNLHRLTAGDPLELFVLYSSAAGLLGSPGQAGYAAANAFLDGFAHWRRAQGLPATSVGWGPWSEVGLAARPDRAGRLAGLGMGGIDIGSGAEVLARVLAERPAQLAVLPLDADAWLEHHPEQRHWSVFAALAPREGWAPVAVIGPDDLERALTEWVAGVLRVPVESVDAHTSLVRLGLDSLMAVELRNVVEARLGVRLSTASFLDGPTLAELAGRIREQTGTGQAAPGDDAGDALVPRLDMLSDAQVDALLDELLNKHIGGAG
ncbi:SDR family NAD(P)-dependent oxidoreductase [Nonomuraea sp. NPDC005650]|uniref:SDR family NAD(P)-dependent oxidoreductase n=1 Tax=Nonomuraea sp. NPDC005650 TaxID=3157045 RepID=UPI0033A0908F